MGGSNIFDPLNYVKGYISTLKAIIVPYYVHMV